MHVDADSQKLNANKNTLGLNGQKQVWLWLAW